MFCRYCGKEIEDGSKFCRFCGHEFSEEELDKNNTESFDKVEDGVDINRSSDGVDSYEQNDKTVLSEDAVDTKDAEVVGTEQAYACKCPNCGAPLSGDSQFCSECGTKVSNENNDTEISTAENISSGKSTRKSSLTLDKGTVIVGIIALLVGAIISGIVTYYVAASPVLRKISSAESKEKDAQALLKDAEKKYKEADEYYAKISNIEVNKTEPKKVHLQGKVTVGVDIAPGMYSMKSKTGDYCSAHRFAAGEKAEGFGDLVANGYGKGELGQVILKAGEVVDIPDGIITFTPLKD